MHLRTVLEKIYFVTGENLSVQRVPNALTNQVYKITSKPSEKMWALRVSKQISRELGIDRAREEKILDHLKGNAWVLRPFFFNQAICLTEWVHGTPFYVHSVEQIQKLSQLIHEIHSQPLGGLTHIQPTEIDKQLLHLLKRLPEATDSAFSNLLLKKIKHYVFPKKLTLCHHDLHPENIIVSQTQLKLLDWEYASLGDPLIDIACAIEGFKLNGANKAEMLKALKLGDEEMQLPICLVQALSLLWYMNRFPKSNFNRQLNLWIETWKD
ncbi:phosphotransferase [Reinekea marinisedimentorum]|uniref:Thiamine kinase-like enzyme n=1 Tax=Reinekea marinisedimentorum TaxID=230495 RepID=A0A4R3HZS1_9GAMM|nr:phosphotransferase [Reinekea marinisedimentorum]TCS38917.1 thiamine kinase-like enzyme [Reinekea marinisedimentorum]